MVPTGCKQFFPVRSFSHYFRFGARLKDATREFRNRVPPCELAIVRYQDPETAVDALQSRDLCIGLPKALGRLKIIDFRDRRRLDDLDVDIKVRVRAFLAIDEVHDLEVAHQPLGKPHRLPLYNTTANV